MQQQYIKYNPDTYQVTECAPQNKGGILNYNSPNNHEILIAEGYSFEFFENGYLAGHAPQPVVPTIEEQNEVICQIRKRQYALLIDPLHARKLRKEILGTWGEADEAEYVAEVQRLSAEIEAKNPYLTDEEGAM